MTKNANKKNAGRIKPYGFQLSGIEFQLAGSYVFALLIGTVAIYGKYVIRLECGI